MKRYLHIVAFLILVLPASVYGQSPAQVPETQAQPGEVNGLVVLWATGEKDVFTKMVHIYTLNAMKRGWFGEITLIVWGPSAKLLAEDAELQEMVKELGESGVILEACIWCSNQYNVTDDLKSLNIDVKGMGVPLTGYIKDPAKKVVVF